MKRSWDDNLDVSPQKKKRKEIPKSSLFLPINTGLTYSDIIGFRVIQGFKGQLPNTQDFMTQEEAESFLKSNHMNFHFGIIRALLKQIGFYLEDEYGSILDTNSNKRYQYINMTRVSEWDLTNLNYQPIFKMI